MCVCVQGREFHSNCLFTSLLPSWVACRLQRDSFLSWSTAQSGTWLVKELLMTKLGWPMAQPRFTSLPSASRMICLPVGTSYMSTCVTQGNWREEKGKRKRGEKGREGKKEVEEGGERNKQLYKEEKKAKKKTAST